MSQTPKIVEAALAWARQIGPVFPCHPRTKQPLTAHGFKDASRDEQQIVAWWTRWPRAMIGTPTGSAIGAFVIDIDAGQDPETGEVFETDRLIEQLVKAVGPIAPSWKVRTPRGGLHIYFALPSGVEVRNRTSIIARVDVRGEGGYVVLPPSIMANGRAYVWETAPQGLPLAEASPSLQELVCKVASATTAKKTNAAIPADRSSRYGSAALLQEVQAIARVTAGGRNDRVNRAAFSLGQLVATGTISEAEVVSALEAAAVECGLVADDGIAAVRRTIASGLSAGLLHPRQPNLQSDSRRTAPRPGPSPLDLNLELSRFELTDRGNARRFVRRHEGRLAFCASQGWLHQKGGKWVHDEKEMEVRRAVHETVDAIKREAKSAHLHDNNDE